MPSSPPAAPAGALVLPGSRAVPRARGWAGGLAGLVFALLLLGVTTFAVTNRVAHLADIPRYTDEINEIIPAFDIVRGRSFPLVSGPKHIGAFWDYLLAGGMLVFGRSPDLPRTMILTAGLATLVLTYGYGRSLGGRWAGLVAMGLLAVSAPHVLLSSRVAWSACLTPLLAIGATWALDRALSHKRPWHLLTAGLLTGLGLQAHPSFLALVPGLAIYAAWRGRHLLRRPQPYLAGLLLLLACSNVLIYNAQSGFGGIASVDEQYPDQELGTLVYADTALAPARGLLLTLASAVDPTREASVAAPFVLLVGTISVLALAYAARRASALPALVVLSALVVLPLVHDEFAPLLKARYLMPLVPLTFVAIGVFLVRAVCDRAGWPRVVAVGLTALLMTGMQLSLTRFEAAVRANDCTNAPQRAFVGQIERHLLPGEWILLDQGVLPSAERFGYLTLLELSSRKVGESSLGRGKIRDELEERTSFLTAVSDGKVSAVFEAQRLPLLPQTVAPVHPALRQPGPDGRRPAQGIGLYRVSSEGAALLFHDPAPGCGDLRTN